METLRFDNLNKLTNSFATGDFVLIGETHGVLENASLMGDLLTIAFTTQRPLTIAFEWLLTSTEQQGLEHYIQGISENFIPPNFFNDSDGRVTATHLTLLDTIREYNSNSAYKIQVATFDSNQINRAQQMAENLIAIHSSNKGVILVETGAFHAKKFGKDSETKSLADILSMQAQVGNIFLSYESGTVTVEGKVCNIQDSEMQSSDQSTHFDYTIVIPTATAAI